MFLLDLPIEILLCIAECLDKAKDIFKLAFLNRATSALFLPFLCKFNVHKQRSSALLWSVIRCESGFVGKMLHNYQADANTTDNKSRTPIFHAIRAENETIIRMLLFDKRADINWQDKYQQTPLIYAMRRGLRPTASLLLDFNPCLDKRDHKHRSAIWYAIAHSDESLVEALLKRGGDICTPDYKRISPISLAIAKKSVKITRMLLLHSENISGKSLLKDTHIRDRLLWRAVQAGLQDIVSLLVANGANPNSRTRDGKTLLHQATEKGDRKVVQQLLTYKETSVKARDIYGRTVFHIAAEYGHQSIIRLLLIDGAVDINALDVNGATALCLAVHAKHTAIGLQILANDHVRINVAGQNGRTALHHAVMTGNMPIICALLDNEDLDPNIRDNEEWVPLTHAAFNGDLRVVELLLVGKDIQVNVEQAPPLFYAAKKGHLDVVRRLLCVDTIDINQQFWNISPLCTASEMGHFEVAKLLLQHTMPPDINLKTYLGNTALSLAAYNGHLAIIDLLLAETGLDVTATDKFGETALCKAARNGHEQVVKHLYKDPRAKGGSDVKDAVEATSNCRIALYLQDHLNEEGNFCS
ncbi:hypothetical protein N7530_002403 [Penicillium desertorum]|uniref:F-box domain-containing protein n=1 Tax=Penicillium desertorum TaxID=1303715 RepID=A0A9X0BT30_9EURO|nr:hypothetical protein N7530_002403 [Penicillium desertorum]